MKALENKEDIAVQTIVDAVRSDIIAGRIPADSVINSVELAARFGTSRTPVREALLVLAHHGLVILETHKRPRVAPVSVQAIRDLYGLRMALHAHLSDIIVHQASDADLADLHAQAQWLAQHGAQLALEDHLRGIERYLDTEYRLGGNALILQVLASLQWRIAWFRRLGWLSPAQLAEMGRDRLRVVEAYQERDAVLAGALNQAMLRKSARYTERNFLAR
ncbi:hypothetical protein BBB39_03465 [Bordetella trematum]|uniref:GntR family transcriptional regulator n=1 Tax=Bordetella trematum TaxID=123899 RepID=A0A157SH50_9BORD|nr:GntR family transcriptional regulator [Bordetella trematum]AUL46176.1 hypothetical protein BTL55_03630 [Bordetella trematum]AZR92937.1 hypothetical protein BBB39_03465 [Bordetella trematum]NNH19753.1 GntR family transcriptional regulator [Bordetella trematum]CZZ98313.1 GntR family transcriptional regulator [Bordetella trematum]SAI33306.1 GntR family transcriptional regulator [Bordetella trematum]